MKKRYQQVGKNQLRGGEMIPQLIFAIWFFVEMLLQAHYHGKQKKFRTHNFWSQLIQWMIIVAILVGGGFFDCWIK